MDVDEVPGDPDDQEEEADDQMEWKTTECEPHGAERVGKRGSKRKQRCEKAAGSRHSCSVSSSNHSENYRSTKRVKHSVCVEEFKCNLVCVCDPILASVDNHQGQKSFQRNPAREMTKPRDSVKDGGGHHQDPPREDEVSDDEHNQPINTQLFRNLVLTPP